MKAQLHISALPLYLSASLESSNRKEAKIITAISVAVILVILFLLIMAIEKK